MNTQNVNVNTATPESPKTWDEGHKNGLRGISPVLAERLDCLSRLWLRHTCADERDRALFDVLHYMAEDLIGEVTGWSRGRPVMSAIALNAWMKARRIACRQFGSRGETLWQDASSVMVFQLNGAMPDW